MVYSIGLILFVHMHGVVSMMYRNYTNTVLKRSRMFPSALLRRQDSAECRTSNSTEARSSRGCATALFALRRCDILAPDVYHLIGAIVTGVCDNYSFDPRNRFSHRNSLKISRSRRRWPKLLQHSQPSLASCKL